MTVRAEAASPRASAQAGSRARDAVAEVDHGVPPVGAPAAGSFLRSLAVVLTALRLSPRSRLPDAGSLTERQLADIGLARSDLPDHRGWRR